MKACLLAIFCAWAIPAFAQDTMDESVVDVPAPAKSAKPRETAPAEITPLLPPGTMQDMKVAELRALDKITARVSPLEAPLDQTITFGSLNIVVKACRKAPAEDRPESAAFVQVWEQKPGEDSHWVYSGWLYASSPALTGIEHPVYDIWLTDCRNAPASPTP
jgi:hypothetical protein